MRYRIHHRAATLWRTLADLTGANAAIVVTPPTWRVRIARTVVAVFVLTCAFQLYAWLVVPWIEPPPPSDRQSMVAEPVMETVDAELAALFPEGAWERANPMVLKTQAGRLLFQDFQRHEEDGRIELRPCTIVFLVPAGEKDGEKLQRPVILQTPGKAVLSFTQSPDLLSGRIGKLQGALLDGEVRIWSGESRPGANDALMINTRNVQILPEQIWTPHEVVFQYGGSHGSGRDLTIRLTADGEKDPAVARQALVQSIETLELAHVDKLLLDIPGRGLLGDLSPASPAASGQVVPLSTPPSAPTSTAVDVTCQGPFHFDFQKGVAQLEDQVRLTRLNPLGPPDQLDCHTLLISFQNAEPQLAGSRPATVGVSASPVAVAGSQGDAEPKPLVPKLLIRSIEALGEPVTLQAPSVAAAARGQSLHYDFVTRRIALRAENKAWFVYRQNETEAFRLEYTLPPDSQRLGRLTAAGPGVFRGAFGKESDQRLEATWNGQLELYPQDNLHVLSAVEGATIQWNKMGHFSADKLYVWLAEVEPSQTGVLRVSRIAAAGSPPLPAALLAGGFAPPSTGQPAASRSRDMAVVPAGAEAALTGSGEVGAPRSTQAKPRVTVQPVKMLAEGNVLADSPQFHGNTPRLEIWFDQPTEAALPAAQLPAVPGESPQEGGPAAGDAAADSPLTGPAKRLELSGNYVRLRILMLQPKPVVREATVLGQVRLEQVSQMPVESTPLLVLGDMLQLRIDGFERSTVDVHGEPARVQAQGLILEGADLHVSQRENRMWADGPGRMTLPARAPIPDPAGAGQQHRLASSSPIWISWQGGMNFDGQVVSFSTAVEVRGIYTSQAGERLHLQSRGDRLEATLNRYVAFDRTKDTEGLDVSELRFLGDVYTENQTFDEQDVVTSHDYMRTRDLNLDRRSGKFTALGRGWIVSTRVDKGGESQRFGLTTAGGTAGPARPASGTGKLSYLRIDFENAIEGNLNLREAEFVRYVRTVYGPVSSWDEVIDPERPSTMGPQAIVMTCRRLLVAEIGDGVERAMELSAEDDTVVEGSTFVAKADRITYAQRKDTLILEGAGRALASLSYRARAGEKPSEFQARKIKYCVGTGLYDVEGFDQFQYDQMGNPDFPKARLR